MEPDMPKMPKKITPKKIINQPGPLAEALRMAGITRAKPPKKRQLQLFRLILELMSGNPERRLYAVRALGSLNAREAIKALTIRAQGDPDEKVRANATRVLKKLGVLKP